MSTPCRLRNNSTNGMKTLGIDVGSSSVKVSLLDVATGECAGAVTLPSAEMPIDAPQPGWAEQDPRMWWIYALMGLASAFFMVKFVPETKGKSLEEMEKLFKK